MAKEAARHHIDTAAVLADDGFSKFVSEALDQLKKKGVAGFAEVYLALVVSDGNDVAVASLDSSQAFPADPKAILADMRFKTRVDNVFAELVAQGVSETVEAYFTLVASDGVDKAGVRTDYAMELRYFQQWFLTFVRGEAATECTLIDDTPLEELIDKARLTLGDNEKVFDGDNELDLDDVIYTSRGDRTFTIKVVEADNGAGDRHDSQGGPDGH